MRNYAQQIKQLLAWHKKEKIHLLFDPTNARENLISLVESLAVFVFYFVIVIMILHLLILNGLFETETLSWLIVESLFGKLMKGVPASLIENKLFVSMTIIITLGILYIVRLAFNITKARMHPGSRQIKYVYPAKKILHLNLKKYAE